MKDLEQVGFSLVGYGCTTCIGNSGPLPEPIHDAIDANDLVATSVLSGNRNFEGRISPDVRANYLASPPLVVAYALAGTVDIDLSKDPLGQDQDGNDVMLSDIWPSAAEITAVVESSLSRDQFIKQYADVYSGPEAWQAFETTASDLFHWESDSTYIHRPPFFDEMTATPPGIHEINGARVLVKVGDSVTTDHISPAGSIATDSPAGKYLDGHDVPRSLFNSYGSRRGNDLVLTRGTFANIRIRNQIAPGTEGGWTTDFTDGEVKPIYDASCNYRKAGVPLIVLAGQDYGMGSSRDWAAKGPCLLGVKVVIARSFERIHRSNLVGMGILPLQFRDSEDAESLGLDGTETFSVPIDESLTPRQQVDVSWTREDGSSGTFATTCRIDTPVEVEYYCNGGILHTVVRRMAAEY
jgi:aconitate hydratase